MTEPVYHLRVEWETYDMLRDSWALHSQLFGPHADEDAALADWPYALQHVLKSEPGVKKVVTRVERKAYPPEMPGWRVVQTITWKG
jgi:hypothetical protein